MAAKQRKKSKCAKTALKKYRVEDLQDAPYNARTITDKALKGLYASLEEFGLIHLPVVNERDDGELRIVGGHQRIKLLRREGAEHVWCISVKLDDTVERRANFTLNNQAVQGEFVQELTKELLDRVQSSIGPGYDEKFGKLNLDALIKKVSRGLADGRPMSEQKFFDDGQTDEEDTPSTPSKSQAGSKNGVIYQLGEHAIHCGALQGVPSITAFGAENLASMGITRIAEPGGTLNDAWLNLYLQALVENVSGALYIVTTTDNLAQVQRRFVALHGHWSTTLLWMHPEASPDAEELYRDVLIPVIYGWPEGAKRQFYGEKCISNVFTLTRQPQRNKVPVELITRAMTLSTCESEVALDVDIGDGASVIAAQKMKRVLYGYCRSPHQCDKVRKRWAEFAHGPKCQWKALTPARV